MRLCETKGTNLHAMNAGLDDASGFEGLRFAEDSIRWDDKVYKLVLALGFVSVALKLLGFIHWSWWWVTLPLWGPIAWVIAIAIPFVLWAPLARAVD